MTNGRTILLDPHPRRIDVIFAPQDKERLEAIGPVICHDQSPAPVEHIDAHLGNAMVLIGQTPMPAERLAKSPHLRAILNVEGNFLPNIDYEECHRRNIAVLSCAPAFAQAVAEMALGMALAAAREIVVGDADFRAAREVYGTPSNARNHLLHRRTIGLIGCGNVGRSLLPMLRPFGGRILAHDPWLHPATLTDLDVLPATLNQVFNQSQVVFILAAATTENSRGLTAEHFGKLQRGAIVVLLGRADVVDFDALLDAAASGQIRAAIDVFPQEPLAKDHRVRRTPNTILSAHRAGGLPEVMYEIGRMAVDDVELIVRSLPPQRMQRSVLETVTRYCSKPIK